MYFASISSQRFLCREANPTLTHLLLVPHILLSLVQIMACRQLGAKPLPDPMLTYSQLDTEEQFSDNVQMKFNMFIEEMHFKMLSAKWRLFCPGGDELNICYSDSTTYPGYNWYVGKKDGGHLNSAKKNGSDCVRVR